MKKNEAINRALEKARLTTPIKTGRLRYKLIKLDNGTTRVYIDTHQYKYPIYINGPGYKTQGWWERFQDDFTNNLATLLATKKPKKKNKGGRR